MNPGISTSVIVVLAIIVVILALALIAKLKPNSTIGKDVTATEAKVEAASDHVMTAAADLRSRVETEAAPVVDKIEVAIGTDLQSLLAKVETKLTDTTGEDAGIAAAQTYLARVTLEVESTVAGFNAAKAAKLAALQLHVTTLQASIPAPVTGS